jgi:hypothetical protein
LKIENFNCLSNWSQIFYAIWQNKAMVLLKNLPATLSRLPVALAVGINN